MAKSLTEDMVVARTKISDLTKIKRLNCWGSEISDISLLRRMPNVEVLSLSINKINSLADIQKCERLEELFIRQNDIRDLNQVVYLQNLRYLRNLWLGENPCANCKGYRLAVLKALPQLQKFDNVQVTQEELREAQQKAFTLYHPEEHHHQDSDQGDEDEEEDEEEEEVEELCHRTRSNNCSASPPPPPCRYNYGGVATTESSDNSPSRQEGDRDTNENGTCGDDSPSDGSPSFSNNHLSATNSKRRNSSSDKEQSSNTNHDRSTGSDSCEENPVVAVISDKRITGSKSANCIKEYYANGEPRFAQQTHHQHHHPHPTSYSTDVGGPPTGSVSGERIRGDSKRYVCPAAVHKTAALFNRRPVTRNSNILSAVLCLVKELDYPSLEVVEMTVRCRMDEIDD